METLPVLRDHLLMPRFEFEPTSNMAPGTYSVTYRVAFNAQKKAVEGRTKLTLTAPLMAPPKPAATPDAKQTPETAAAK
jgi:hypothetical protein